MSDSHYFSKLLHKNIWLYFFSFLIAPTGYIVKIIIAGSVSVEELGILYGIMSLMLILGSYNDFGMTESLNYFLPGFIHEKDTKKITNVFSIALTTQMVSSTVLAALLYFGADWLALNYFNSTYAVILLKILVLQFYGENIFRTLSTFFQAIQDTKLQKLMDFTRMIILTAMVAGLYVVNIRDVEYYAWAWSLSVLVAVIFSLIFVVSKYRSYFAKSGWSYTSHEYKTVLSYAVWAMLSTNVGMLLSQVDMQMVVYLLGAESAGYYTNYLSLIRIPFLFLLPGVYFLFPVFSDLIKRGEVEKVTKIYCFMYEFFAVVALMMTSFFMLFGSELTITLFGSGYAKSGEILLYSSPFLLFNFLLQIDFQVLSASGRPRTKMFILLAGLGLNIITNYIFLYYWGVVGSAFASGIGWIFIWLLSFRVAGKYAKGFRWSFFIKNGIGILCLSAILYLFPLIGGLHGRIALFLWLCGIIFLYWCIFILLNTAELQRFWRLIRAKKPQEFTTQEQEQLLETLDETQI